MPDDSRGRLRSMYEPGSRRVAQHRGTSSCATAIGLLAVDRWLGYLWVSSLLGGQLKRCGMRRPRQT